MKTICSLVLAAAFAACAASQSVAAVALLSPSADTTLNSSAVNNSAGGGNGLFVGDTNSSPPVRRGLIQFDLTSIPAGAVISKATLTMVMGMSAGPNNNQTIELHRLTSSWGEGTVLSGPASDTLSGQGNGAAANPGDANWSSRFFGTTLWTTAGGDFDAAASAVRNDVTGSVGTSYTWSSPTLTSDVQGWFANPGSNNGWLIKNPDETTLQNARVFFSRNTMTVANRPVLEVTYTVVPEPSTWTIAMICTAVAYGLSRMRREYQRCGCNAR